MLVERPFNILITLMEVEGLKNIDIIAQLAIYTAVYFGFIYIFLLRTFLLLWNFKHSQATSRLIWKKVLNPDYDDFDNFYLRYNHWFGDFTNIGPCAVMTWILAVFILLYVISFIFV